MGVRPPGGVTTALRLRGLCSVSATDSGCKRGKLLVDATPRPADRLLVEANSSCSAGPAAAAAGETWIWFPAVLVAALAALVAAAAAAPTLKLLLEESAPELRCGLINCCRAAVSPSLRLCRLLAAVPLRERYLPPLGGVAPLTVVVVCATAAAAASAAAALYEKLLDRLPGRVLLLELRFWS